LGKEGEYHRSLEIREKGGSRGGGGKGLKVWGRKASYDDESRRGGREFFSTT